MRLRWRWTWHCRCALHVLLLLLMLLLLMLVLVLLQLRVCGRRRMRGLVRIQLLQRCVRVRLWRALHSRLRAWCRRGGRHRWPSCFHRRWLRRRERRDRVKARAELLAIAPWLTGPPHILRREDTRERRLELAAGHRCRGGARWWLCERSAGVWWHVLPLRPGEAVEERGGWIGRQPPLVFRQAPSKRRRVPVGHGTAGRASRRQRHLSSARSAQICRQAGGT